MTKENSEIMIVDKNTLRSKIYVIRSQQVMLDVDLAEIYGYETRYFNRQVQNNKERFRGDDFMFQLTKEEYENLMCKNFTSSWGGTRKAFCKDSGYKATIHAMLTNPTLAIR